MRSQQHAQPPRATGGKSLLQTSRQSESRATTLASSESKLDVRGERTLVIAPPSTHSNGKQYKWINPDAEIATAPDWLLSILTAEDVHSMRIKKGDRNPRLFDETCALLKTHPPEDVLPLVLAFNAQHCDPPYSDSKVKDIVARATKSHKPLPADLIAKQKKSPLYWYQFDVNEFLADQTIQSLTDYQIGWRARLQAYAWLHRGRLLNDPEQLATLAHAPSKKKFIAEMGRALFDFEAYTENGQKFLVHRGMAEAYDAALGVWDKRRLAGMERARQREKERQEKKQAIPQEVTA